MEDLNKNQLILLALLVSFVTSIATGIVTVALMEQAPQSVTQTINKVITQTIEKVVTEKAPAAVIQASEDDLIASALEKNSRGVVKIRLGQEGDIVGWGFQFRLSELLQAILIRQNLPRNQNITQFSPTAKSFHF